MNLGSSLLQKGMLVCVVSPNFTWLHTINQSTKMVQVPKWSHLVVLGDAFCKEGSIYVRYPVLFEQRTLCLFEPRVNFHLSHNFLKIV